jgi:hypothetical protein
MSVLMELHQIIVRDMLTEQIIVLKEVDGERQFPMVIEKAQDHQPGKRHVLRPTVHSPERRNGGN